MTGGSQADDPHIPLLRLALEAGTAILSVYRGDFAVHTKEDRSPVTEADERAEAIILAGLAAHFPDIPVIAEEEAAAGRIPKTDARFFLVDPLDGTKEFIKRNDEFTVNIALIDRGTPVAGVVYAPALGRIFVASQGRAAAAEVADGVPRDFAALHVRPAPPEGLTVISSRSHGSPALNDLLASYPIAARRMAGSSLKFCLLASGEADLYPRLGPTMEWDTAAGDAVLRAAGGAIRALDGAPFVYGKRGREGLQDFLNPGFLAASSEALLWR